MNPSNGLLLCRFCDKAFEIGDIMVEKDFGIEVSENLYKQTNKTVQKWISSIQPEIRFRPSTKHRPDPRYLKWKKDLLTAKN